MFRRLGKYLKVAPYYFLYSLNFFSFNSQDKLESYHAVAVLQCNSRAYSAIPVPTMQTWHGRHSSATAFYLCPDQGTKYRF